MLGQTNLNDDGSIWIKTTPDGQPLIRGKSYFFEGQWWVYIGDVQSSEEVPNIYCCYTIGNKIKIHRGITQMTNIPKEKIKRKRVDDSRPINTDISDQDSPLMVLMKTALRKKGVTRGDFKMLYSDGFSTDSDMNNALRQIETQNNLSWARFTDLSDRLGLDYSLNLYDKQGIIESVDTGSTPTRSKKSKK